MKDTKRTNVIVIMTDQQRADVCAREGFPLDTTPFLDSLAEQGTWFNKAYTAMPICVPARISFLTGRYPSAHRVRFNEGAQHAFFKQDIFEMFQAEGYRTALIGKNHTYIKPDELKDYAITFGHTGANGKHGTPEEKKFDQWLGKLSQVSMDPTPFPLECQIPYRCVSAAIDWIQSRDNLPFFMWLSFPEPHNPYQVPEPYYSMFPPEKLPPLKSDQRALEDKSFKWKWARQLGEHFSFPYEQAIPRMRSNYFGMMRLIDDQIRRLMDFLKSQKLDEQTLIVFVSDHGDFVGEYGLIKKGPELPEILTRVPLLFYGPGVRAEATPHAAHVSIVDIFPTLCEAVGTAIPEGVQGRSLWPLLQGKDYPVEEFQSVYAEHGYGGLYFTEDDPLYYDACGSIDEQGTIKFDELNKYSQSGMMRTVRKGEWKLNVDMHGRAELYQISEDPLELNNLHDDPEYEKKEKEMFLELTAWMMRSQDHLPAPKPTKKYSVKTDAKNYWAPYKKD